MPLTEQRRKQLDDIVFRMEDAGESDDEIGFVVNDFKSKYENEPSSATDAPKDGYLQGIGEYWTKDIPEAVRGVGSRTMERANRITKPTVLGSMAQKATGTTGLLGETVEGIAGTPERIGRAVGGAAGTIGDVTGSVVSLGSKAMNNLTGGNLGKITKPIGDKVIETVAGNKNVQDLMKWYEGLSEAEKANYGSASDMLELVGGYGGGKTAGKVSGKLISGPPKKLDEIAGKIAQWTTGVDEPALRMAGTKEGRTALKGAFGKQYEIGKELVKMVDNFDDYIPEKAVVNDAIRNMPEVKIDGVIDALRKSKLTDPVTDGAKAANKKIDDLIGMLVKEEKVPASKILTSSGKPAIPSSTKKVSSVSADKLLEYRRMYDNEATAAFDKDYKDYIEKAVLNTRKAMKDALIDAANQSGNKQYVAAMKSWSDKLEKLDKLKYSLGKNSQSRSNKAESFISNLFNRNKTEQRNVLKEISDVFGNDFVSKSQLARYAEMMGDEGAGEWLPRWTTGRSNVGAKLTGIAVGSPKIASRVTLPMTRGVANTAGAVSDVTRTVAPALGVGATNNLLRDVKAKKPY